MTSNQSRNQRLWEKQYPERNMYHANNMISFGLGEWLRAFDDMPHDKRTVWMGLMRSAVLQLRKLMEDSNGKTSK